MNVFKKMSINRFSVTLDSVETEWCILWMFIKENTYE
jgi:hypothetical protein